MLKSLYGLCMDIIQGHSTSKEQKWVLPPGEYLSLGSFFNMAGGGGGGSRIFSLFYGWILGCGLSTGVDISRGITVLAYTLYMYMQHFCIVFKS